MTTIEDFEQGASGEVAMILPSWMRKLLDMLTVVVSVRVPDQPDNENESDSDEELVDPAIFLPSPKTGDNREWSVKLLLSLFVFDSIAWITGKVFLFEVVRMAQDIEDELGFGYILATALITTIEVLLKLVAAFATPTIYRLFEKSDTFTSQGLASATIKAYCISSIMAIVVYPILAIIIYFVNQEEHPPLWIFVTLLIVQSIQFSFMNRVGDTMVNMAVPHWLHTFQGYDLVVPGYAVRSTYWRRKFSIERQVTADSLALYLEITRYLVVFFFGALYILIETSTVMRWVLALSCALANTMLLGLFWRNKHYLLPSIVDLVVEDKRPLVLWPWQMKGFELSLIAIFVMTFSAPEQALNSLLSIIVLEIQDIVVKAVVSGVATLIVFSYLLWLTWKVDRHDHQYQNGRRPRALVAPEIGSPEASTTDSDSLDDVPINTELSSWNPATKEEVAESGNKKSGARARNGLTGSYSQWLATIWVLFAGMVAGVVGMFIPTDATTSVAIALIAMVLIRPLQVRIKAMFNSFLFMYDSQRSSNIALFANVFGAVINVPILALNFLTADGLDSLFDTNSTITDLDVDGEEMEELAIAEQGAMVLAVSTLFVGAAALWFLLVDPLLGRNASLRAHVNRHTNTRKLTSDRDSRKLSI